MRIHQITCSALLGSALLTTAAEAATPTEIVEHYSTVAHATYEDALISAKVLQQSINSLLAAPSEASLENAREAWKAARVPYQQSEVFRFGNGIVDDWEGSSMPGHWMKG